MRYYAKRVAADFAYEPGQSVHFSFLFFFFCAFFWFKIAFSFLVGHVCNNAAGLPDPWYA